MRYRVILPIARGPQAQERYAPGAVIELDGDEAAALAAAGAVQRLEGDDHEDDRDEGRQRRSRR